MAVFRIEKTRDYTVMSNYHLRDMSLSLKAKGLLSLMLSLPENWDYTMKGLARICKDGIDSISGGIRELEAHGYLIRSRVRSANGQLGSIEYTILEQPKSPVDILFDDLAKKQPDHFAVKQYVKFKMAAGKTLKSILVSCGARLAPFDIKELRDIMTEDELELDTMGDQKTALFLIMSDTDTTFNFVIAMLQSQLFNLLCDKADDFYNGRLPVHVRCLLDEFANIGQIPNFDKLIATIRSREISASIILQSQSQLKTIYKDAADTIVGNCDSTLFLGGKEKGTLKEISELLGKETIDSLSQSENRGAQTSHGLSYQKLGKELMTQDEIAVMDGGKCILQLRGVRPFFSDKFDITKHPRYQYLSDADKRNVFDVERYMKRRPAIVKPDEPFDMYELNASDLEPDNNNSTKRKEK